MAKKRINTYKFTPGIPQSGNLYPNAWAQINANKEWLKDESNAYIDFKITEDTAADLYPSATLRYLNNREYVKAEVAAWVATQVSGNISPFAGYTKTATEIKNDVEKVINAAYLDMRYGGNENVRTQSSSYYVDGVLQLASAGEPELAYWTKAKDIINLYIFTGLAYGTINTDGLSQNTSGSNAEANGKTAFVANMNIIDNVVDNGIINLPALVSSSYVFANFTYEPYLCERDMGYNIDGLLTDLRYGGNEQSRYNASTYWVGTVSVLSGDRQPEIAVKNEIRNIINNYVIPGVAFTSRQSPVVTQQTVLGTPGEAGATSRITSLVGIITDVIENGLDNLPAQINNGISSVKIPERVELSELLLITNTTDNNVLYTFNDPAKGATATYRREYTDDTSNPTAFVDPDFPKAFHGNDTITTIFLNADTSTDNATDQLQIFIEDDEIRTRPYDFGTDAIERMRVAQPESMLDADFEYGLQPTKWQAIATQRGYPSIYEVPGTDFDIATVTSDASAGTQGIGSSLITVTTIGPHNFEPGQPFTITGFDNSVAGASRAAGSFVVNTVPTTQSFTYYGKAKVGQVNPTTISTNFTQLREGDFYTGAAIGFPSFSVDSNGSSGNFTTSLATLSGSTILPYTGVQPEIGAPLSGTGIQQGTQITAVNGSGGALASPTVTGDYSAGATEITVADSAGIIQNSVIDRGDGFAVTIINVAGNSLTLSAPLNQDLIGDVTQYTNLAGVNYTPAGQLARFDVFRVGGSYSVSIVTAGGPGTGQDYAVGDAIIVSGTDLGGATPANDATILVESVDTGGEILTASISGTAFTGTGTASAVSTIFQGGVGTGAQINVTKNNGSYTVALNAPSYTNVSLGTFPGAAGEGAIFDVDVDSGVYTVTIDTAGTGYILNDVIRLAGSTFGGTGANDLDIRVTAVGGSGEIQTISAAGTAPDQTVNYVSPIYTTASAGGVTASFTVTRTGTSYSAVVTTIGTGYSASDQLVFAGTQLGGATTANDMTLTVDSVDGNGGILTFSVAGTSVNTQTYADQAGGANVTGQNGTFDVDISGTTYTVTLNNAGDDYGVGQTLTIPGTSLGGATPANDVSITVDSVTGTGASGIATFTATGTAALDGTSAYKVGDQFFINGSDLGGSTTTNDAYVTVSTVNGNGGITGLTITGTGTDANVDYASPTYTTSASGTAAVFTVNRTGTTYSATFTNNGSGFIQGETITIAGTELGGLSPANDCTITADTVSAGAIATYSVTGTAVNTQTFTDVNKSNRTPSGLTLDVTLNAGTYTIAINNPGSDYAPDQEFKVLGTNLFGASPTNDMTFTVTGIDAVTTGAVTVVSAASGTANTGTGNALNVSGTNRTPQGVGAQFSVTRTNDTDSSTAYTEVTVVQEGSNYAIGDKLTISGSSLGGSTPANDIVVRIQSVTSFGGVVNNTHEGTAIGGTGLSVYSSVTISDPTTQAIPLSATISYSALATMRVDFTTPHGLVPGNAFLVVIISDDGANNHILASGPFLATSIPSPTSLTYQVRSPGAITDAGWQGSIYGRPDSFFIHRPFDGGVQLGTGGPAHGAQAIRQSKKYIRYQSGKGCMYTTGALFAPSYDILNITADGIDAGSTITVTTDDVDHNLQVGAVVRLVGVATSGYDGEYTITSVINERSFTVIAQITLGGSTPEFTDQPQVSLYKWNGATVRSGIFDDQNGIFWEYDGQSTNAVQRTATRQLAGTVTVTPNSNNVSGVGTRFREQIKAGDRVVIRGMTHVVSSVTDNTTMSVTPDYRGVNISAGVKMCAVVDKKAKQSEFNKDKLDGTGPSGYKWDVSKMQMIGIQFSWYGAGFIDWMTRGHTGNFIFVHRMRNSNVNTEAFMRTGNQPVRYEVTNEGPNGRLSENIDATQTTITLEDASFFPSTGGTVYIDNEVITFTGITGDTLTGCTRAAQLTNFAAGATRNYSAGTASTHFRNTGVVLISNTASPIISHWGSAYLTDGNFDEDRGYLFNYSGQGLRLSTIRQTVFLMRLAPSVSNALTGDLGDRDLLNRAQLLLDGIEITTEPVAAGQTQGQLVVQGIINPQNYPIDPADIGWTGLQGTAQGGQPSFAQIAPGGSVNWNGGASTTTQTADTQSLMTSSSTHWFNLGGNRNYMYFLEAQWEGKGHTVGMSVTSGQFPANTVVTQISDNGSYYFVRFSNRHTGVSGGEAVNFSYGGDFTGTNYLFFDPTSWEASGAVAGTEVDTATTTEFPPGTTVQSVQAKTVFGSTEYYRVDFNQTFNGTISAASSVSFTFGQPPYAQPGETIFSFIAQPGERATLALDKIKALTNTTLGGRGTFPNGPDVLAINVFRTAGTGDVAGTVTLRWSEAQA
jgi:hypothetical protein